MTIDSIARYIFEDICRKLESTRGFLIELRLALRKTLLKIVAGESVSSEISFLGKLRQAVMVAMEKDESKMRVLTRLSLIAEEMYRLAIDKQVDLHFH